MSIVSTDIVAYAAASQPEDESSTAGGAIDTNTRVVFSDLGTNGKVDVVSSAAGDTTQTATIRGRLASGAIDSEVLSLNGTTPVLGTKTFERLESVTLNATCAGVITVSAHTGGGTLSTVPIGELAFIRLFINAFSSPAGAKAYYAKIFIKNKNGSLSFLNAAILENADPTGKISFALEDAVNDTHTVTNRLTAPGSHITAFDSASKNVPGTNLAAGDAIGVWVKLSLSMGDSPIKSTWTVEADGQTV